MLLCVLRAGEGANYNEWTRLRGGARGGWANHAAVSHWWTSTVSPASNWTVKYESDPHAELLQYMNSEWCRFKWKPCFHHKIKINIQYSDFFFLTILNLNLAILSFFLAILNLYLANSELWEKNIFFILWQKLSSIGYRCVSDHSLVTVADSVWKDVSDLCRPSSKWFKDDAQLDRKDRILTLTNLSTGDSGIYFCCAQNAAGKVCSNKNITLNIFGKTIRFE